MPRTRIAKPMRSNALAPAIVVDEEEGWVRVCDPRIFHSHNRGYCEYWAEIASRDSEVVEARFDLDSSTCQVNFRPGTIDRKAMARSFAESIFDTLRARPTPTENGSIPPNQQGLPTRPFGSQAHSSGRNRTRDYALAVGSLAMTGVAIIVPGVPTIPFLLASSYYLARTSPRMNQALRTAPFFGPILQELEEHKALSRKSKRKLMGFTFVLIAITLATTEPTLPFALLMMVAVAVSLYSIDQMPEIAEEAPAYRAELRTT